MTLGCLSLSLKFAWNWVAFIIQFQRVLCGHQHGMWPKDIHFYAFLWLFQFLSVSVESILDAICPVYFIWAQLAWFTKCNFIRYSGWIICKLACIFVSLLEYKQPNVSTLYFSSFCLYSLLALIHIVLNWLNQPIGIHLQFLINYAQASNQYLSQLVTPVTHNTSASCGC